MDGNRCGRFQSVSLIGPQQVQMGERWTAVRLEEMSGILQKASVAGRICLEATGRDFLCSEALECSRQGTIALSFPWPGQPDGVFQVGRQLPPWLPTSYGGSVWELSFTEQKGKVHFSYHKPA